MPLLDQAIKQNIEMKEASILVLGIISDEDACQSEIEPFLPTIIPFLANELKSNSNLIKTSTYFALQKFANWIIL